MNYFEKTRILGVFTLMSTFFMAAPMAQAQGLNNNSWSPQATSRASIAALIYQVEKEGSSGNSATAFAGSGSVTQLICGDSTNGDSPTSSNAQANSSCIILNNSDGANIDIGQDSVGDQDSNAESTSTVNVEETINGADDVLATLNGD